MSGKDRENFLKHCILVVDNIKDGLTDLIQHDIDSNTKYSDFEDFINQNQHDIYHMYDIRDTCCQDRVGNKCKQRRYGNIYEKQIEVLFDRHGPKLAGHNPRGQNYDFCCSQAKQGLSVKDIDVTLARCLLLNFCKTSMSGPIRTAIDTLKDIRNTVYGHATQAQLSDTDFATHWNKTEPALMQIATMCGTVPKTKQRLADLTKLRLDETLLTKYQNQILEEVKSVGTALAETDNRVRGVGTALAEMDNRVRGVGTALVETDNRVTSVGTALAEMDNRVRGVGTALAETDNRVRGVGTALAETDNRVRGVGTALAETDNRVRGVKTALAETDNRVKGVGTSLAETDNRVRDVDTALADTDSRVRGVERAIDETDNRVKGVGTALADTDIRVRGLGTALEQTDNRVRKVDRTLDDITKKLEKENEEKRRLCEENATAVIDLHEKEKTFVTTSGLTRASAALETISTVVIVGPSGSGKSTTAVELLRQYHQLGYVCAYVNDVNELLNIATGIKDKCIILCDDIFGKTNCIYNEDTHSNQLNLLYPYVQKHNIKLVITTRESILQMCRQVFYSHRLFLNSVTVNLGSDFKLTVEEKRECLVKHCYINDIEIIDDLPGKNIQMPKYILSDTITEIVSLEESPLIGFPQACTLFTSNDSFTKHGVSFFKNANTLLCDKITNMRKLGKQNMDYMVDYTLLVYVLVNNNKIDLSNYDIEKVNKVCTSIYGRQKNDFTPFDIKDSIERLKGIYLKKTSKNILEFQHRSIFEAVLLSYKTFNIESIIQFMDLDFIVEMVRPEGYIGKGAEMFITVDKLEYQILANQVVSLLVACHSTYSFVERLMASAIVKENGVQLIKIILDIINSCKEHVVWRFKELKVVSIKANAEVRFYLPYFDFVTAFWIYCDGNEDLIQRLLDFPIKDIFVVDCLFISCVQLNTLKAQNCWELIKRGDHIVEKTTHSFFSDNIENVLQQPYLKLLFEVVDDWDKFDSYTVNLMVKKACTTHRQTIAIYLIRNLDKTRLFSENEAMINACDVGFSKVVEVLLDLFDKSVFNAKDAFCHACNHFDLHLMTLLLNTFEPSCFDVTTSFNKACYNGDLELVKWILLNFDHSLLDIKKAFNNACQSKDTNVVTLLLQTFDQSLFEVETAFNKACRYDNANVVALLLRSFDKSVFDVKTAMAIICKTNNLDTLKLFLQTFDHSLLDCKTAFITACENADVDLVAFLLQVFDHKDFNEKKAFEIVYSRRNSKLIKLLLQTFAPSPVDVTAAFNNVCYYGDLELVEWMLQTFDHSLLDIKTAFNNASKSNDSNVVNLLLHKFDNSLFDVKQALNIACQSKSIQVVTLLLRTFNKNKNMFDVRTAFQNACHHEDSGIILLLLQTFDNKLLHVKEAFIWFCKNGNSQMVFLLLETCDHSLFDAKTALNIACETGNFQVVNLVIWAFDQRCFDVEMAYKNACCSGNSEIIELFRATFPHSLLDKVKFVKPAFDQRRSDEVKRRSDQVIHVITVPYSTNSETSMKK